MSDDPRWKGKLGIADGTTVRTKCGHARLTYNPDWSPSRPWCSYKNGTAGRQFASLELGMQQLTRDGYRFAKDAATNL